MAFTPRTYRASLAGVVASLILLLASCSSPGTTNKSQVGSKSEPGSSALPLEQQNLNVGYVADTARESYLGRFQPTARIFDTLVHLDEHFGMQPMLAERWERLEGEKGGVRFHLRRGVMFHDGSEVNADDVKASFDFYLREGQMLVSSLGPDSVRAIDSHTVDIVPTRPDNRLLEQIVHPSNGIFKSGTDPRKNPVGAGPFRFIEYEPERRLVVERFADYWDRSRVPKLNRITFNFVPDAQARLLGLRSGTFHVIAEVAPDEIPELKSVPGARPEMSSPGAETHVDFNLNGPEPYVLGKEPIIRQAVAFGVDRKELIETVYKGTAVLGPLIPELFGQYSTTVNGLPYDPEQARRLLEEAGWQPGEDGIRAKNGRRLSLVYMIGFGGGETAQLTGEVLKSQLKEIGVELQLATNLDPGTSQARRRNGEYDVLWGRGNQTKPDPCFLYDLVFSGFNKFHAPGGRVKEALEDCKQVPSLEEARKQAAEVARLLTEVEVLRFTTGISREIWGVTGNVREFRAHPVLGLANWEEMFLGR